MSDRVAYLRDQVAKCEFHAKHIGDAETQGELRKLAAQYLAEAEAIETMAPLGDEAGGALGLDNHAAAGQPPALEPQPVAGD